MGFNSSLLERIFRRRKPPEEPDSGSAVANEPQSERNKRPKKEKKKKAKRTLRAIASHTFDVVRILSDSFGPLKGPASGVGHAKDVWQQVRETLEGAHELRVEVDSFRDQVERFVAYGSEIGGLDGSILERLESEIEEVEAVVSLLSGDRVASRILFWKEQVSQLKAARAKFQSSRETFLIDCFFATSISQFHKELGHEALCHTRDEMEHSVEDTVRKHLITRKQYVLLIVIPFSFFDHGFTALASVRGDHLCKLGFDIIDA